MTDGPPRSRRFEVDTIGAMVGATHKVGYRSEWKTVNGETMKRGSWMALDVEAFKTQDKTVGGVGFLSFLCHILANVTAEMYISGKLP